MMHGDNIFQINGLFSIFGGLGLLMSGAQQMFDSGYRPPDTPIGWAFGLFCIGLGGVVACTWFSYTMVLLLVQKLKGKRRWSITSTLTSGMFLVGAMSFVLMGVWLTWRYPYKLGPCDCLETQWGPQCVPCTCGEHGACDWGQYGTGACNCDPQWGGTNCDVCGERWKPEPQGQESACTVCKTGYAGEDCEECAKGYAGSDCAECAFGWQPWTHKSELFPNTIADDDGRHLCDECRPNHFGYYCNRCPYGNDVPLRTLAHNRPVTNGTLVKVSGLYGTVQMLETLVNGVWSPNTEYDPLNFDVLTMSRVTVKDEITQKPSVALLSNIDGVQCNNRGTCLDDTLVLEQNSRDDDGKYPWEKQCSYTNFQSCSTHLDCLISENCRGRCQGVEMPIDANWLDTFNDVVCEKDSDCQDELGYLGGRCTQRACCDESHHGTGLCQCEPQYFGELLNDGVQEHYQRSPACDFCPGYDWFEQTPNTICSGGKGTCVPSFSRTALDGAGGLYQKMSCACGEEVFVDPITKIVYPDKIIAWSGMWCECGDWDNDAVCNVCADGFWGEQCQQCPGGSGLNQCSRHGKCDSGVDGTGECICDVSEEHAWMLAPFEPRYKGEETGKNHKGVSDTCTECAPNYWGETCQQCDGMEKGAGGGMFPESELRDIFQPVVSLSMGQSSSVQKPTSICNRGFCYLACGGGGWCNWGRKGDGTCSCWSNSMGNEATWNPLDNVCMGTKRGDPSQNGYESCPSFGWCSGGSSSRINGTFDACGTDDQWIGDRKSTKNTWNRNVYITDQTQWSPFDDWKKNYDYDAVCEQHSKGQCRKWLPISWVPSNSDNGCQKQRL